MGFVGLVLPMLPPIAASLWTPFFGIITIPISIYRGGDGDDSFCGASHVRQIWDGHHLDPPERRLGEPEAPRYEERHAVSLLRFLRFLRSCIRRLCPHTRLSDSGDDLQDPGIQVALSIDPLHRSREGLVGGPLLCG